MSRRGFTLIETLMVIAIIGVVTAIAIPSLRAGAAKRSVRSSRNTLMALYGQARMAAVQQGRSVGLRIDENRAFVAAEPGTGGRTYDTVGAVRDLGGEFGVTLSTDRSAIMIDPKGFTLEGAKVMTRKDGYADSVMINRYGRIRK